MGPLTTREICTLLMIWTTLAILAGALVSWIWTIRKLMRDEPVLPEEPLVKRRKVSWGWGVLLAILAYLLVNVAGFSGYALATRGLPKKHTGAPARVEREGAEKTGAAGTEGRPDKTGQGGPPATARAEHPLEERPSPGDVSLPELMFVNAAISSLLLLLIPLILRMASGVRLRDLGLQFSGWRRQVAIGVVALVWLLPIIYTVQVASLQLPGVPDENQRAHPVQKMLKEDPTGSVAYLAVLTAVLLAPALEELLFRGVLQSWLIQALNDLALWLKRLRSRPLPPSPDLSEIPEIPENDYWAVEETAEARLAQPDSCIQAVELADEPALAKDVPYRPQSTAMTGAAIVITSLVFASLHAAQWPAPIALFVLSLGLGIVYFRTGSLLVPIFMHALFNGLSTLMMFLTMGIEPAREKPILPPVEQVAPVNKGEIDLPHVDRVRQGGKR